MKNQDPKIVPKCQLFNAVSIIANGDQLESVVYDGSAMANGDLAFVRNSYIPSGWPYRTAFMRITSAGEMADSVLIESEGERPMGSHVYPKDGDSGYFITGSFSDSTDAYHGIRCFVAEVSDNQVQLYRHGPRFRRGGDGLGFMDADGSLVYGYYHYQNFWSGEFDFEAVRHCPGFGACDSVHLNSQLGTGRVHAMVPLADGSIGAIMPPISPGCSPSPDAIVLVSPALDIVGCNPIPQLEADSGWNMSAVFDDNLTALVLGSGNLLVCGMFDHALWNSWQHPVAIARITPQGELLAARRFYSSVDPAITMRPGIMRGMSASGPGTFAFAYSDSAWGGGPSPEWQETSNIHVLKMDTALNVLGEYVFNGDAINRYHFLSSVVASPDGAVYVMGSVYDHDAPVPMPKAWVARVGPEQFASVPEAAPAGFALFPNPGSQGFSLCMASPAAGAVARLCDAQGRVVREQALGDARAWIDADALPPGPYLVQVTARDGSRFTAKWVKE